MKNISINPDNQIFRGNLSIGFIEDGDVYYFVREYAEKIGSIVHKSEVELIIRRFEKKSIAVN